jgi:hypothetical protein
VQKRTSRASGQMPVVLPKADVDRGTPVRASGDFRLVAALPGIAGRAKLRNYNPLSNAAGRSDETQLDPRYGDSWVRRP